MTRRQKWKGVLDSELKRWSEMPLEQLFLNLKKTPCYEVESGSKRYQVEVSVLDETENYLHVSIAVDDGSLPASICPLTGSFIHYKGGS